MTESERKRRDLIFTIQKMHQDGDSIHEIARITGKERKTVKKYLEGKRQVFGRIDCSLDS